MAIIPETAFPGKIAPSSPAFPFGEARDVTVPGDGTGTPWKAVLLNDLFGFQQALLSAAGITPTGNPDEVGASQYLAALRAITAAPVENLLALLAIPVGERKAVSISGLFSAALGVSPVGGGGLIYQPSLNKNLADGVVIIDPDNAGGFDGTQGSLSGYFTAQGGGVGTGCWVRVGVEHVNILFAGAVGEGVTNDTESTIEALAAGGGVAYVPQGIYLVDDDTPVDGLFGEGVIKKSYGSIPVNRGEDKAQYADVSEAVLSAINPREWQTDGNYAYVVCQGTYNATDQGVLDILDVRDKYDIHKVSSINIGAVGLTPRALSVYGNYVYAQSVGGILHIFDVTDKANPLLVKTVNLNAGNREYGLVSGDTLIIPKQTGDIDFYSLRDPINPELLSTLAVAGSFYEPMLADTTLWVSNYSDGTAPNLLCVDISDARNPVQLSFATIPTLKYARLGTIKGKYLYMGGLDVSSRLNIIDISDATAPAVVYTAATEQAIFTEIIGNTLIADRNLYDITDPISPILLTSIPDLISRPKAVGSFILGLGPGTGAQGPASNDGDADPTLRSLRVSNWQLVGLDVGSLQAQRAFADEMTVRGKAQAESLNLGSGGCASTGPVSGERVSSRGVIENTKNEVEAVSVVLGDISSLTDVFEFSAENAHTSFELSYTLVDNQALAVAAAHTVGKKSFSGFVTVAAAYGARIPVGDSIAERVIGTASVLTVTITNGAASGDPVKIGVSCPQLSTANARAEFRVKAICSAPVFKLEVL